MQKRSFLTKQQIEVLRLRELGLTQREIANRLGTTRENVSIIEKRGRENIRRCIETLKEWERIKAPISLKIQKGTDVLEIPGLIFREGDKNGIKIRSNLLGIIARLVDEKGEIIRNRHLIRDLEVMIMKNGEIKLC
ncbi:MAG TPA: Tfx family DNA-binding protein [Candidatus Syntrophoarchaeum butanivorans]|uniref:RNA polymerase sigma70 n=1 Tax=Candidatus Syntropharchaeum butanivorans TaxID=1839936 RepID=A0A1F2P5Y8_9EURY|nr:MAG: RNA polymerase sigma70 [Candidatus Syntrophoarchaeum butanivorans]HEC57408.1 Tfx family DNA-binding protein [Candidatus Syntrophoarchaeum butanivorans]